MVPCSAQLSSARLTPSVLLHLPFSPDFLFLGLAKLIALSGLGGMSNTTGATEQPPHHSHGSMVWGALPTSGTFRACACGQFSRYPWVTVPRPHNASLPGVPTPRGCKIQSFPADQRRGDFLPPPGPAAEKSEERNGKHGLQLPGRPAQAGPLPWRPRKGATREPAPAALRTRPPPRMSPTVAATLPATSLAACASPSAPLLRGA